MNNQNLVIYEFDELYKIFFEIKKDINLNFEKASIKQLREINLKTGSELVEEKSYEDYK